MYCWLQTLVWTVALMPTVKAAVRQGIDNATYAMLDKMATLTAVAPTNQVCESPAGYEKLYTVYNPATSTDAFVVRDDVDKQIIVTFRGTEDLVTLLEDLDIALVPFTIDGADCPDCQVAQGTFEAYLSVVEDLKAHIDQYMSEYQGYTLIINGHSLGGALASICAAHLSNFYPNAIAYSMGQFRTGNPAYAAYVDAAYDVDPDAGSGRFYRSTHEDDGVPQIYPQSLGYYHHGVEYWNRDPTGPENTYVCTPDDTTQCNGGTGGVGINPAHLTYYGHTVVIGGACE